jgi:response regulator NasT
VLITPNDEPMHATYRIAIADDDREALARLRNALSTAGHQVLADARDGGTLVQQCLRTSPDLVISEVTLAGTDGLKAVESILKSLEIAVVILSASVNDEVLDRAITVRPMAYLLKPFREDELCTVISITMLRFQELQALREEVAYTRQALEERKAIERAKGILMKKLGVDESTAFRQLQKTARDYRHKIITVAESVIFAENAFQL